MTDATRDLHIFRPGIRWEHRKWTSQLDGLTVEDWIVSFHARPDRRFMTWEAALEYMRDTPENWVERGRVDP